MTSNTQPPKFTLGDRVYRRTINPSKTIFGNRRRREGTICGRQDVTYKNQRKHKAYWVLFDRETAPVHIEQSMLRRLQNGEAQDS